MPAAVHLLLASAAKTQTIRAPRLQRSAALELAAWSSNPPPSAG
ncbi:hypothetical protein M3J09_004739 [Ascochyta lentis]